jgi:hypothetical protein
MSRYSLAVSAVVPCSLPCKMVLAGILNPLGRTTLPEIFPLPANGRDIAKKKGAKEERELRADILHLVS